jgi:hypothetical protein
MNDINPAAPNLTAASITPPPRPIRPALDEIDFYPIEKLDLAPFIHTLLKLGQFLTQTGTRREIDETKLSTLTHKYSNKLHIRPYQAKEIREQLWGGSGEFRGGGVVVEWCETSPNYGRFQAHYEFSFSRIYRPEELSMTEREPAKL